MALARKPKPQAAVPESTVDVEALINKGGSVGTAAVEKPAEAVDTQSELVPVALRLPRAFEVRIATARKGRAVKIPRHTWILEAILEKLEKEGY